MSKSYSNVQIMCRHSIDAQQWSPIPLTPSHTIQTVFSHDTSIVIDNQEEWSVVRDEQLCDQANTPIRVIESEDYLDDVILVEASLSKWQRDRCQWSDKENIAPCRQSSMRNELAGKKEVKRRQVFEDITQEIQQKEYQQQLCENVSNHVQDYSDQVFRGRTWMGL